MGRRRHSLKWAPEAPQRDAKGAQRLGLRRHSPWGRAIATGWLRDSVYLSVCLFVCYRNHFPVVQFQNQTHIQNPHGTGQVFKTIWVAVGAPIYFYFFITATPSGVLSAPQIIIFIFFYRRHRRRFPKWEPKTAPETLLTRRAREVPPKSGVSRVYIYIHRIHNIAYTEFMNRYMLIWIDGCVRFIYRFWYFLLSYIFICIEWWK